MVGLGKSSISATVRHVHRNHSMRYFALFKPVDGTGTNLSVFDSEDAILDFVRKIKDPASGYELTVIRGEEVQFEPFDGVGLWRFKE